jgi:O-antigen ligase
MSSSFAAPAKAPANDKRSTFAFNTVLAISVLYYARPEDVIPGFGVLPMVKIAGALAVLALLVAMTKKREIKKLPLETKLLILLFAHMIIGIPFAYWSGGAFQTVFTKFSKGVIVAVLVTMLVTGLDQLRKLLWIQAASLAFMTMFSIGSHNRNSRMSGVLGGVFENPNDLAINIALNWPICLGFFLLADKAWKKAIWAAAMFVMVMGVVLTYSRSGFIALIVCGVVSLYEFGLKGKRLHLLALAGIGVLALAIAAPIFGLYPKIWVARMESSVLNNVADSHDKGSKEARTELLRESIKTMAHHPLFGVGAGNFQIFSGNWHVAHNTYTEFGAEAGLPALFLFLCILARAFYNLRRVEKSQRYKEDLELRVLNGAMWASCAAYLIGAFFSDTEYELFPYFMVAYTSVLYHVAYVFARPKSSDQPAEVEKPKRSLLRQKLDYEQPTNSAVAWNRR